MATLNFTFEVEGVEPGTFVVVAYEGKESISDTVWSSLPCYGFRYRIELASRIPGLNPADIVDKKARLTVWHNGQPVQYVHGSVRRFARGDTGYHHSFYSVTLVPELERLSLRHNSRIFQFSTVPEIFSTLLQEMGVNDFAFALTKEYAQREFCVQYRESDLDFIHRLAAEEGITYQFEHEKGKHTLLFTDSSQAVPALDSPVPYNALSGGQTDEPYVSAFEVAHQSEVSHLETRDYSFKKPAYSFLQSQQAGELDYQLAAYEHFDYLGRYKNDASGRNISQVRLGYLRRQARTASGKSNHPGLRGGLKFTLTDHTESGVNREWLVTEIHHQGSQPQALEEEGTTGATTYTNQFALVPSTQTWQAIPQPKPQMDGPCIATVAGPEGEEIFCDEFGRVKVHFPWDRESQQNEHSSCWVRVSQGWAGAQYGFIAIPRIGNEVIVEFLNGDPDQPIITGRTYHATNVAPYLLPNHKTQTVLKTRTHQGEGYNELRFEDQSTQEQIYLHAQKDMDTEINHIHRESVGVDRHTRVGRHFYHWVAENMHRLIGKNVYEEYGQDHQIKVGRNLVQRVLGSVNQFISGGEIRKIEGSSITEITASEEKKIGANQRIAIDNESSLEATKIILNAEQSLTIQGQDGFIKLDNSGVTISGNIVKINDGGSPDRGTAPSVTEPAIPDRPQEPEVPDNRKGSSDKVGMAKRVDSGLTPSSDSSAKSTPNPTGTQTHMNIGVNRAVAKPVQVNPNNMYWPPYNPLAPEGQKQLHVEYVQPIVSIAVLSTEEAQEFYQNLGGKEAIGNIKSYGDLSKGVMDAYATAKGLGGLGVKAYTKNINGKDWVIIRDFRRHQQTLMKGNKWGANNPKVIQAGLGLNDLKGAARYVKFNAGVEIAFAVGINAADYIMRDEATLAEFVGSSAGDITKGFIALGGAALFTAAIPVTMGVMATGMVFAVASFFIGQGLDLVDKDLGYSKELTKAIEDYYQ